MFCLIHVHEYILYLGFRIHLGLGSVARITYTVLVETLNPAQSTCLGLLIWLHTREFCQ